MNALGRPLFAVFALLAGSGCAATLVCPVRGGRAWTELESAHFVLDTDLEVDLAAKLVDEFERVQAIFEEVAFASSLRPKGKVRVIQFSSDLDYRHLGAGWSGGEFLSAPSGDPEGMPTLVFAGQLSNGTRFTFQHELTHRFVAFHYGHAPIWVNEGLAEYFSTLRATPEDVYLGAPVPRWVPQGELPTLDTLNQMSPDAFYAGGAPGREDGRDRAVHYSAAWAWVHFFETGPEPYRSTFAEYLARLAAGASATEAWASTLGRLDADRAHEALLSHGRTRPFPMLRTAWDGGAAPPPHVRSLTSSEVHLLWAEHAPWATSAGLAFAREHVDEALREAPTDVRARALLAWVVAAGGEVDDARALIDGVLTEAPDDATALLTALRIELSAVEGPPSAAARLALTRRLDPIVKRLRRSASTGVALNALASYYALRREPEVGLAFARRALEADPSCAACWVTYGALLADERLFDGARAAETTATNLLPPAPARFAGRGYSLDAARASRF